MKDQAQVVIVVRNRRRADRLSSASWRTDVVLFEKGRLQRRIIACRRTRYTVCDSQTLMQFASTASALQQPRLFDHVGACGLPPAWISSRSCSVASAAQGLGMDVEVISPQEALKIMPQLSGEKLYGAIYRA